MADQIICFLSQGWVGAIVGIVGVVVGLLGLYLYRRSRIPGIIACQSHNVSMIGGDNAVLPAEVVVRYRETLVPRVTASTVWMWNAGKKTVEGTDVVAHDPLGLRFDGEVLNVRIIKVTREVLRIRADTSKEEKRTVCYGFEFLDPGDGGVLEVLHTGSPKAPECIGTIKGLPKGLQYWRSFISSKWERKEAWLMSIVGIIIGLEMTLGVCAAGQFRKVRERGTIVVGLFKGVLWSRFGVDRVSSHLWVPGIGG